MITVAWTMRRLHRLDEEMIESLADVLIDCVEGGAVVSFLYPLERGRALAFWQLVAKGVAQGERALLVVEDDEGVCGTVQLVVKQSENSPHRAYLSKLLVHRRARRQGLGEALIRGAEAMARSLGKTLLTLDTATGDAERLYQRMGWVRVGSIPGYGYLPHGGLSEQTWYYKQLAT